jgi:hypothetical protein
LEVIIPGPMRAKKIPRVLQNPLRETFSAAAGMDVWGGVGGKVGYLLLPWRHFPN